MLEAPDLKTRAEILIASPRWIWPRNAPAAIRDCSDRRRRSRHPTRDHCRIIQIMTVQIRYLTHPQVKIEPAVPVPSWGLSDVGRARTEALANAGWLSGTTQIICSGERKAIETAAIIAGELKVTVEVRDAMHENDRSTTGFLPPDEFETVADQFFAHPLASIRGWSGPSTPNCASSARSNGCWPEIDRVTCCSSATAPSAPFVLSLFRFCG